jgi:hypothetical protein
MDGGPVLVFDKSFALVYVRLYLYDIENNSIFCN